MNNTDFPDVPANYHGGDQCFSYVDGHEDSHKWKGALKSVPDQKDVVGTYWDRAGTLDAKLVDWVWLAARTSYMLP